MFGEIQLNILEVNNQEYKTQPKNKRTRSLFDDIVGK